MTDDVVSIRKALISASIDAMGTEKNFLEAVRLNWRLNYYL